MINLLKKKKKTQSVGSVANEQFALDGISLIVLKSIKFLFFYPTWVMSTYSSFWIEFAREEF